SRSAPLLRTAGGLRIRNLWATLLVRTGPQRAMVGLIATEAVSTFDEGAPPRRAARQISRRTPTARNSGRCRIDGAQLLCNRGFVGRCLQRCRLRLRRDASFRRYLELTRVNKFARSFVLLGHDIGYLRVTAIVDPLINHGGIGDTRKRQYAHEHCERANRRHGSLTPNVRHERRAKGREKY